MGGEAAGGGGGRGVVLEVLGSRAYQRWSLTAQLVRLPSAMVPLSFVLLATAATGNYRLGGVMLAAATVAEVGLAAPASRRMGRGNLLQALSWSLLAGAVLFGLLAVAGALSLSGVLLVALAVASCAVISGTPAGMRAVLTGTVPPRLLTSALAVDGVLIEITAVTGPLLVAAAALAFPVGGVSAIALVTATAALLVRRVLVPPAPPETAPQTTAGDERLWTPVFAVWVTTGLAAGHGIGLAEIVALPLAQRHGGGTLTAVLFQALLCAASAVAGLTYAARSDRFTGHPLQRVSALLAALGAGAAILAWAPSTALVAVGYVLVGLCTAPLGITVVHTLQALAPAPRLAEAFGLNSASTGAGFALAGAAVATFTLPAALLTGAAVTGGCALLTLATWRQPPTSCAR